MSPAELAPLVPSSWRTALCLPHPPQSLTPSFPIIPTFFVALSWLSSKDQKGFFCERLRHRGAEADARATGVGMRRYVMAGGDTRCNHGQALTRPGRCYGVQQPWEEARPDSRPGRD